MLNNVGDIVSPCLTPTGVENHGVDILCVISTLAVGFSYIFRIALTSLPVIPILSSLCKSNYLSTRSNAFCTSMNAQKVGLLHL